MASPGRLVKKIRAMPDDIARNRISSKAVSVENVLRRIKGLAVHLDHVVKMGSCGKAAASDQTHDVATLHAVPFFHQGLRKMAVQCFDAESMIQLDRIP